MEQTMVTTAPRIEQMSGVGRLQRGMAMGAISNLDAFSLVFQQMAEAMGQVPNGEGVFGALADLPQQGTKNDARKQDMTASMQELVALMMSTMGTQPDVVEVTPEQVESMVAAMGQAQQEQEQSSQNAQQTVASMEGQSIPLKNGTADVVTENVMVHMHKSMEQAVTGQKSATTATTATNVELPVSDLVEVNHIVERPVTHTSEGERALYDGQNMFQSAVETAKRQMGVKKITSDDSLTETMAVDTGAVPSKEVRISDVFSKVERIGQGTELAEQIDTGVKENLALGKREFTLKLKPEALGEITVKLVEKAGKTVLTISTASTQTAKLINNDLAALREAVKPMAVEVHEAVSQPSDSPQAQMQQFNMSGQQFSQQQQRHFYANSQVGSAYYGDDGILDEQVELEQVLESDGLDTYI